MIVACATDRNYVEMSGVMLRSVVDRGEIPEAKFRVFGYRLTDEDRKNLIACVPGADIQFVDIAAQVKTLARLPERIWPHVAFARIFAPDLVPDSGRMLYLDGDTVVNRSLRGLLDFPMQGHPIAAIPHGPLRHLKRDPDIIGFNSGVLLFDLEEWRARGLTSKVLRWPFENRSVMKYPDQDALNAVLGAEYAALPAGYNMQSERGAQKNGASYAEAYIIHFTGTRKPNVLDCDHPSRGVFLDSRSRTPWANAGLYEYRRRHKTLWERATRLLRIGVAMVRVQNL